jgi:hypothetical protein
MGRLMHKFNVREDRLARTLHERSSRYALFSLGVEIKTALDSKTLVMLALMPLASHAIQLRIRPCNNHIAKSSNIINSKSLVTVPRKIYISRDTAALPISLLNTNSSV